jgi:thiamine transport system substrate-binding protein
MKRREYIRYVGTGAAVTALAGCSGEGEPSTDDTATETETGTETEAGGATETQTATGTPSGTLRVATYSSFTGEDTAGSWLKSAFESAYPGVTVEFTVPENGVNQYILRAQQGAPVDADLYIGLNTGELVRADEQLDTSLFAPVEDELEGTDDIKPDLRIDPDGRAIPYDTGYISLVYNANEVENPGTFDALTTEEYAGDLITQNAQQSDPGRAFLLWTIAAKGRDGYLDYWEQLLDNDVTVLSDWEPAYQAYMNEEAPIVVSYSTDQVFYHGDGVDIQKHQVGFLNDQGYANPEAMGLFRDADSPDLGRLLMEFVLTAEAQKEIAVRNVQFPAVEGLGSIDGFSEYAYEPPEPVTFTYDELSGNVETWVEDWARVVAGN